MLFYHIGAGLKIFIGVLILWVLYVFVNVYQDYLPALAFGFLGIFLASWGLSFYFFLFFQSFFAKKTLGSVMALSYKLSLLFGIFVLINAVLFVSEMWTKFLGLVLFVIFVLIDVFVSSDESRKG
ncbi:MAG TPA: hypothetical protein PKD96_00340 [Candidatus Absconditabacterales bacterium]|nr:hypothetical protein [Candidatus Absconditabacterales bacterium]HMT26728.1 hypothetical protein [Candidatus Absconditabacterales bacterium]